jgi:glyoxylase-like metal-dependent hydrolase (beta-lactamase superfamily II)
MKVKIFVLNPFGMNCYIYYDEKSREGVIIDPGAGDDSEKEMITDFLKENGINIKYIINTHGHIDHILGNKWAKDTFKVPVMMHKGDSELLKRSKEQGVQFGLSFPEPPNPDVFLEENDTVVFGDCTLKVLHTPGHSPGGICLIDEREKIIFAGDTIFRNSIGRTDLMGGDMDALLDSINNKLFKYSDDYTIYPGHYEPTTIGEEKEINPFLK